jgi:hypothetical protein
MEEWKGGRMEEWKAGSPPHGLAAKKQWGNLV